MRVASRIVLSVFLLGITASAYADVPPAQILEAVRGDLTQGRADQGLQALGQVLAQIRKMRRRTTCAAVSLCRSNGGMMPSSRASRR